MPEPLTPARDHRPIAIGDEYQLGPGSVQTRANGPQSVIKLDAEIRLTAGRKLTGKGDLDRSAQVLGTITAHSIRLGPRAGRYRWPIVDEPVEHQTAHHPPKHDNASAAP